MTLEPVRRLMDGAAMDRALRRMALEVVEREGGAEGVVLVGIRTRGVPLAERLARHIREATGAEVPLGAVDITLYRDDNAEGLARPEIGPTELPFDLAEKKVVLVDDVLYTGRTVRAALDAMNDYGRPRRVRLAVLVDRGLRELPIHADYVGLRVETEPRHSVKVRLAEQGEDDAVELLERR